MDGSKGGKIRTTVIAQSIKYHKKNKTATQNPHRVKRRDDDDDGGDNYTG